MRPRFFFYVIALAMIALVTRTAVSGAIQADRHARASWYGPGLYGNHLGCGGRLTMSTWGVAHKWLRCGTLLRLCYRRCTRARVVDRGPYVAGREFDLTYPVKRAIGMPSVAVIRWSIAR